MLKAETLAAYRAGLDRISDGAAQYVERMLREAAARHLDMTVAEWRDFAAAVMQAAAETYGEAGASLACDLYDARVRATGYDQATMGVTLDPARAMATARYQAGKVADGDLDGFIRECSAFCSDYVREATNSTMTGNWKRSRRSASRSRSAAAKAGNAYGVRFARVPQGGDTCTFCAMLASRGFVYWSRETAGEFDHYHRNCRCLIVPDDGSGEVEGYDPDEWLQRWRDYEEIDADASLTNRQQRAAKRLIALDGIGVEDAVARVTAEPLAASPVFLNKSSELYRRMRRIEPLEGYYDVMGHSDGRSLIYGDLNDNDDEPGTALTMSELRDSILADESYDGGPIRVIACNAGRDANGLAQRLADVMGVNVLAPTTTVYVDMEGTPLLFENDKQYNEHVLSGLEETGKWADFKPRSEDE